MIIRTITAQILKDLDKKVVLLSGPRQSGKTTLSQTLFPANETQYLNYDVSEDRNIILKKAWDRSKSLIIFDELHKLPKWKSWIKGIYDKEGVRPRLLVTGSARLDLFKKAGDSLAGRHHFFRLHPFSVAEVKDSFKERQSFARLISVGGYPEPFLENDPIQCARWRKSHLDRILKEDLLSLEEVKNITQLEVLVDLLAERVGSTLSYSSLAKDLQVAPRTVQRWIDVLERLFVVFVVRSYSKNIAKSILKEPKIYFFDTSRVKNDIGARFENAVAASLLKRQHFLEDTLGEKTELFYLKDRNKHEVDFLTVRDKKPEFLIETKVSDLAFSPHLFTFRKQLPAGVKAVQLINQDTPKRNENGAEIFAAWEWLNKLET